MSERRTPLTGLAFYGVPYEVHHAELVVRIPKQGPKSWDVLVEGRDPLQVGTRSEVPIEIQLGALWHAGTAQVADHKVSWDRRSLSGPVKFRLLGEGWPDWLDGL